MQLKATIANAIWTASNLPAYWSFRHALHEPQMVQRRKLLDLLRLNANTAFGRAHRFSSIRSYKEFANRVPLSDYASLESWVTRIQRGETNVLTGGEVTHLIPTSGSSGARKL